MKDMTRRQFLDALKKHGMTPTGFMGYVEIPSPKYSRVSVSRFNAGPRLRDQLAYLLREKDRFEREGAA